ncbi:hypothetical protein QBC43DRAFT_378263 [Cladorrhinum sp. PSN259]|nr:hypothetical protein QBC43DRAFT_378263 [Cladorrhinum sp. PSN259]
MRLINVKTCQLEQFLDHETPPYAILSHTWGDDAEELTLRDIQDGRIDKPGVGSVKFHGSCQQAEKDGFGYVWIDTCCIDKTNLAELNEAINSMFRWYRDASVCYAYLSDVPGNDNPRNPESKFRTSRWFERGWTLQELLAPRKLQFYNSEWDYLGTRGTMRNAIEKITGIPRQILLGITELRSASIAQRMSWAARRETKRKEDLAYCLLGIFDVVMPMIYGEGADQAFLRLQYEIMKRIRDDSILAWGLTSGESPVSNPDQVDLLTAGRILATSPSDFANSGHIICREQKNTSLSSLDISGGSVRLHLSLVTTSAGGTFGLLNCGPSHEPQQAVGIPLAHIASGTSNEYARLTGCNAVLQPTAASSVSPRLIHIRNDSQHKNSADAKQQYWLYDEDAFAEVNLDLVDVNPLSCWDQERAMIVSTLIPSDGATQQTLARFRNKEQECPDFIMLLESEQHDTYTEFQCHVMICRKDTSLQELADKLQFVTQKAYGKRSASNGLVHLHVTIEPDVDQSMVTIKPEALPHPRLLDVTVDITAELQKLDLMRELTEIWETKKKNKAQRLELEQEVRDKSKRLEQLKREREMVEEELRKLEERRRVIAEEEKSGAEEMRVLSERQAEAEEQQEQVSKQWSHSRKRWKELWDIDLDEAGYGPKETDGTLLHWEDDGNLLNWAAENGYADIAELLLNKGTEVDVKAQNGDTPLRIACQKGNEAVARLLLDRGADITAKSNNGWTTLNSALNNGHIEMVKLLLDRGADTTVKNNDGWTPLSLASNKGHIEMLLLDRGADITVKSNNGWTPLSLALNNGHIEMVKLLLDRGADITLLLDRGADITVKNNNGRTPLNSASENGHVEVVKLLEREMNITRFK